MKRISNYLIFSIYALFIILSVFTGFEPGKNIGINFLTFSFSMLKVLPPAFIIIGLFEVWVKKETVEKHLGNNSCLLSYLWVLLLAGTTVGGMYVAFPVSASLYKKGAKLSIVLSYLAASAVFRIPMAIFESTFLGLKFTLLRFSVSLPLIIISSELLARYLEVSGLSDKVFTE